MRKYKLPIAKLFRPIYLLELICWSCFIAGEIVIMAIVDVTVGGVMLGVTVVIILLLCCFLQVYVKISGDMVCQTSFFGIPKKRKNIKELKKIQILTMMYGSSRLMLPGDFCVLYFTDKVSYSTIQEICSPRAARSELSCMEAVSDPDVIVFEYTPRAEQALKEITELPIEDKRKRA